MRGFRYLVIVVGLAAAACLVAGVYGYAARRTAQVQGYPLEVSVDSTGMDQYTQQLYQSMQNILNGYTGLPADRLNYYAAVNDANGWVIVGWGGFITNVQPNGSNFVVTLTVRPTLSSDTQGACGAILNADYSEIYEVFGDGTFLYTGFLDPLGLAGRLPQDIAVF